MDPYQEMAADFVEKYEIEDPESQWLVCIEEFGELAGALDGGYRDPLKMQLRELGKLARAMNEDGYRPAYNGGYFGPEETREEFADVVITLFGLAEMLGVNIWSWYEAKMNYNMTKSGSREGGKLVDDGGD